MSETTGKVICEIHNSCPERFDCGGAKAHDPCSECGKCPRNKGVKCVPEGLSMEKKKVCPKAQSGECDGVLIYDHRKSCFHSKPHIYEKYLCDETDIDCPKCIPVEESCN